MLGPVEEAGALDQPVHRDLVQPLAMAAILPFKVPPKGIVQAEGAPADLMMYSATMQSSAEEEDPGLEEIVDVMEAALFMAQGVVLQAE